jgi:hypothetical protein
MSYKIHHVYSITETDPEYNIPGTYIVVLDWSISRFTEQDGNLLEIEGSLQKHDLCGVIMSEDDQIGLAPSLRQWIIDHPDFTITPFVKHIPTAEETRAKMPDLTARQFWMAAANIDIDKDVIIAKIKSALMDSIDRKMMIAELEAR